MLSSASLQTGTHHERLTVIYLIAAIGVVITGAVFRLSGLDDESLFMDEINQVSAYSLTWKQTAEAASIQQQPPLDYYIGHIIFWFSQSDFAIRLPAALFGTASLALLLTILWQNTGPPIALFCTIFYALSPFHIYYSQEARPYSISIFFFLLLLKTLQILEKKDKPGFIHLLFFVLVEFLFLLTRLLAPLCVFISINFLFLIRLIKAIILNDRGKIYKNTLYLLSSLLVALLYAPFFSRLLSSSQRYIDAQPHGPLISGIINFDLSPALQSFICQFDPFGWLLLGLTFFSATAVVILHIRQKHTNLFTLASYLLFATTFLQLFIYLGQTDRTFRPPYAIYIQPLAIIVSACGIRFIISNLPGRIILSAAAIPIILVQANAALTSKAMTQRTEWKQMISYLNNSPGADKAVIFESLAGKNYWKPYDGGKIRYYLRQPSANLPRLLENSLMLKGLHLEPVLVCFYYRDYRLLPTSSYPILPNPTKFKELDKSEIKGNDYLEVIHFEGLVLFTLKKYTGNGLADLYSLIRESTTILPQNETLIDLLILAHKIEIISPGIKIPSFAPMEMAQKLAAAQDS